MNLKHNVRGQNGHFISSPPRMRTKTDTYPCVCPEIRIATIQPTSTFRLRPFEMSKKGVGALEKDAPWRATTVWPVPKIHLAPDLRIPRTAYSDHAISAMRCSDPIGVDMAVVEAAGPECIVPGLSPPVKLLGIKVWPIDVNMKFMEPVERELKLLGKFMDSAVSLMNKSFIDQ